ncbi:hypothetical protein GCM10027347_28540 [Larkinella harenae]
MKTEWSEDDFREMARQLGRPDGESGLKVGEMMNLSNTNMTKRAVESLILTEGDNVLEIGPGNADHVRQIVDETALIEYHGVDISETMVQEAEKRNADLLAAGQAHFKLSDGQTLPFPASTFDKIFTVNTVYFWENPADYAAEIHRVLKPGGRFVLALADKGFMEKLPFTKYGFQLYDRTAASDLLTHQSFSIETILKETDVTVSNLGHKVERPILIVVATRD